MTEQRSSTGTAGPLPCPLCHSTNTAEGVCYVEDNAKEPAVRCWDCGCRATLKAWQSRRPAQIQTDPLAGLVERLDRLCLTSTEDGRRFVLATESARNIVGIVREWLRTRAPAQQTPEREALQRIKDICAGDRVPNWKDDWQTTHSRGRILDICDGALALPSTDHSPPSGNAGEGAWRWSDDQIYFAARALALSNPDAYEDKSHKGSLKPNQKATDAACMALGAAIRHGAAPPQPAPDALRSALEQIRDAEQPKAGLIAGVDTWQAAFEELQKRAAEALASHERGGEA